MPALLVAGSRSPDSGPAALLVGEVTAGTDRSTLLARFVPHANNHPTAKGRQARHDGKPDRQADVQLAQDQPACVSLPYTASSLVMVCSTCGSLSGLEVVTTWRPGLGRQATASHSATRTAPRP